MTILVVLFVLLGIVLSTWFMSPETGAKAQLWDKLAAIKGMLQDYDPGRVPASVVTFAKEVLELGVDLGPELIEEAFKQLSQAIMDGNNRKEKVEPAAIPEDLGDWASLAMAPMPTKRPWWEEDVAREPEGKKVEAPKPKPKGPSARVAGGWKPKKLDCTLSTDQVRILQMRALAQKGGPKAAKLLEEMTDSLEPVSPARVREALAS